MWNKVGVEKDAAGLQSAIEDIEQIRLDLLPDMAIANRDTDGQFRMARCHRCREHGRCL